MPKVREYLEITPTNAREQWNTILRREMPLAGRRQVPFTPVETLLCFGLGLISEPSASGNINIRESNSSAIQLARLFKRPVGSLGLKLANLDGRREHGARSERELWIELTSDRFIFLRLYEIIIDAGRVIGLDFDELPDFLGIEDSTFEMFLEADQVSDDQLRQQVDSELRIMVATSKVSSEQETERLLVATARIGQLQFAHAVLSNCGHRCVFCGLGLSQSGLPPARMLVASHIKAWRASDNYERLDFLNGLAACPTHDAAFDSFLITLDSGLSIVRTDALERAIAIDPVVARNFGSTGMAASLLLPLTAAAPRSLYLEWHQKQSEYRSPT